MSADGIRAPGGRLKDVIDARGVAPCIVADGEVRT
jgi:hypothetical protein